MVMGKRHDQQISVIGLTNLPTHFAWAGVRARKIVNTTGIDERFMLFLKRLMMEDKNEI